MKSHRLLPSLPRALCGPFKPHPAPPAFCLSERFGNAQAMPLAWLPGAKAWMMKQRDVGLGFFVASTLALIRRPRRADGKSKCSGTLDTADQARPEACNS